MHSKGPGWKPSRARVQLLPLAHGGGERFRAHERALDTAPAPAASSHARPAPRSRRGTGRGADARGDRPRGAAGAGPPLLVPPLPPAGTRPGPPDGLFGARFPWHRRAWPGPARGTRLGPARGGAERLRDASPRAAAPAGPRVLRALYRTCALARHTDFSPPRPGSRFRARLQCVPFASQGRPYRIPRAGTCPATGSRRGRAGPPGPPRGFRAGLTGKPRQGAAGVARQSRGSRRQAGNPRRPGFPRRPRADAAEPAGGCP